MNKKRIAGSGGLILTINGGSSSIKFSICEPKEPIRRIVWGQVERVGSPRPLLTIEDIGSKPIAKALRGAADHPAAVEQMLDLLQKRPEFSAVAAVGHRVVHGGPRLFEPQRITPRLIAQLRGVAPLDPDHLPSEIALIEAVLGRLGKLPQVACFDTAFHRTLPRVAKLLPIPRRYQTGGVQRYGFHGLSYTYLMAELTRIAGNRIARGRVILAHLGAGASMAAVRHGKCVETTMGFTPTSGLVMATRSGDLDPGLIVYLMRKHELSAGQIDDLVNRRCGLLGVSQTSGDMRDLLARQSSDRRASEAIELFCYQAKKSLAGLAATLGGVDTLVFAGGIGEHAAQIREKICDGLEFLGIRLDRKLNRFAAPIVSARNGSCTIRIIPTNEEATIVRAVVQFLGKDDC
jgi:acetate kinase